MKNSTAKYSFFFLAAFLCSIITKASNTLPTTSNNIELKVIAKNTVEIKTTIVTLNNEYYELQKSYDNVNFTTVTILMPFSEADGSKPIILKDKITDNKTEVYYRIAKVENETISYAAKNNIKL